VTGGFAVDRSTRRPAKYVAAIVDEASKTAGSASDRRTLTLAGKDGL